MKLELKHLAPYLPYGLTGMYGNLLMQVKSVNIHNGSYMELIEITNTLVKKKAMSYRDDLVPFKPILRPLSDLTKEISIDSNHFTPIVKLAQLFHINTKFTVTHYIDIAIKSDWATVKCCVENDDSRFMEYGIRLDIPENRYRVVEKLFEWHFDVFGLIPAGLAIDINTLK